MPISIQPPPADGSLSPTGSPPAVAVTITMPTGGGFNAYLITRAGPIRLEFGWLPQGATRIRIALPVQIPPGSSLVIRARDVSGVAGNFSYPLS